MIALLAQGADTLPTWGEVARLLTLRGGHNSAVVVLTATLLGLAAGLVGALAMLRRRAMMSDTLAHCTLPGIALAFLAATALGHSGRSLPVLLAGAAATGILGVISVQAVVRATRLREDAAMASVLGVFFGAGVVLLSYVQGLPTGTQGGLSHFIYGQTAAMRTHDAAIMGGAAVLAAAVVGALLKEFRVLCFDDRYAAAIGLPVSTLDLVMMSLVVVVVVVGLQAVGLILIVAMLVIPAAAARLWTERFARVVALSGALGAAAGYIGSAASAALPRLPAGAVIVLSASTIFAVSLAASPTRGLLGRLLRGGRGRTLIEPEATA